MRKKNGFTLIELLSVIVILAIVASVTIYVSVKLINSSKEEGYKVTRANLENGAVNYYLERQNEIQVVNGCVEVAVSDLITYGYLSNKVLEKPVSKDVKINKDDLVYIKINTTTRVTEKVSYKNEPKICN